MTSTPVMPRTDCAAASTALRTASLKEFGELPTISLIWTTAPGTWSCSSDMTSPDLTGADSHLGLVWLMVPQDAPRWARAQRHKWRPVASRWTVARRLRLEHGRQPIEEPRCCRSGL